MIIVKYLHKTLLSNDNLSSSYFWFGLPELVSKLITLWYCPCGCLVALSLLCGTAQRMRVCTDTHATHRLSVGTEAGKDVSVMCINVQV